jgi:hypothetical protein
MVSGMARKKAQETDAIAKLADAGEDAVRQLIDFPHRVVVRTRSDLSDRLHDIGVKLRAIDPLVARVNELEKRVDSLEKHRPKKTSRKRSARPRTSGAAKPKAVTPAIASGRISQEHVAGEPVQPDRDTEQPPASQPEQPRL